jgi:hypothetical protein
MLRWFVICGFLGLVTASSASQAQDDPFAAFNCERAYDEARYAAAVEACRPLADDGLADAQAIMGVLYQNGQGLSQDYTQAALWYDRAARQGHANAQANLANLYRYGAGVPRDYVESWAWFDTAAGVGQAEAVAGRDLVEKRMNGTEIGNARLRAAEIARIIAAANQSPTPDGVPSSGDGSTQALVDGLRALIDQAERERTADYRFLQQLRALAGDYDQPWRVTLLDEKFSDGDFTRSPTWTVASGRFAVDAKYGLRNRFTPPASLNLGSGDGSGGDAALQLFGAVLGELANQNSGGGNRARVAEIHTALAISDQFSVELRFGALAKAIEGGGIEFGPTRGSRRDAGYRLIYTQGKRPNLALLRVSPSGSSIIARADLAQGLEDGNYHRLLWRRAANGAMEVLLDGVTVMETNDRGNGQPFDSFTLINKGGDYSFKDVVIMGAR